MNSDMTEVDPPGGQAMQRGVSSTYSETGPGVGGDGLPW